jgi:hypothetical protein
MTVQEEARWLNVQLLTDVLADLDQVGAALATLTRLGLMAVLDARQFRLQRLATGAFARRLARCLATEFLIDGREVHIDRLVEQQALLANKCFASVAEARALVISQFERQRLNLEVLLGRRCILARQPGLLLLDERLYLSQRGWAEVDVGKFVEQVHAQQFTDPGRRLQA